MRLLVLGGTVYLGRHLVDAALARGHEVTLFNRGRTNADLFPEVERIHGDRDGGLDALAGRTWDAAIDTCGYVPRIVRASAERLRDAVEHYTFISSISVYADGARAGQDESGAVEKLEDETTEEVRAHYGGLKALCEPAAEEAMPGRVLHVRAGLLVGPHDPTGRFTYWPRRVAEGGEVLAPGDPARAIQFIDTRDLAAWIVRMAEMRRAGTYNATGPEGGGTTMGAVLEECVRVSRSDARFTWIDEPFLLERSVTPWTELPLWVTPDSSGIMAVDLRRALGEGLAYRPVAETIRDTLAWDRARPEPGAAPPGIGLAREKEREVLATWRARTD